MPNKQFICNVTRRRLSLKRPLSQQQLARLIGYDRGALSRIESGQELPALATAFKLSQALGVTVDALWPELAEVSREQVLVRQRKMGLIPGYR